jgi:hypothetical protein
MQNLCPHEIKCCKIPVHEVKTLLPARAGHLDCLQLSYKTHGEFERYTATAAAAYGSLECLQFCYENGCRFDRETMAMTGRFGKLDCLQYLVEKGCPWDSDTPEMIIDSGHIDCLRFLLESGCPFNDNITTRAAYSGKLECLDLLVEYGHSLSSYNIVVAGQNGHINCVQYMLEKGFTHPELFKYLNIYAHKLNLDDTIWRDLLFEPDLRHYEKLRDYVNHKKLEVLELKESSKMLYESNHISKDVVQHVLCKYF